MKADNSSSRQFSPHLRVVILGLLLILCTSVKASSPGSRHDSAHVAYGRRNARRAEGGDGGNTAASSQTRGASPDADSSTLSTVLFPRTVLANFGFSEPCVEALSATLSCSEAVRQQHYLYTWGGLTESDIETVCTESCAESFEALRANVATACADDVYTDPVIADTGYVYGTGFSNSIYNIESISARPVAIVDYYHLSYKLLCLKDDKTSTFCYLQTANGSQGTVNECGACGLGAMRLQLEDARTYDESLEREYSASISSCKVTAAPLATPAPLFLPNNNTLLADITTTATCTGSFVALPTGKSCDDFAMAQSVSTDGLLASNDLAGGCANWPGNLEQLCVQNHCQPYLVQQNDTCLSVAAAHNITLTQLLSWNPTVDPLCKNWDKQLGHIICLSNPMGYTLPTVSISNAAGAPTPASTAAPVPTDAMAGSNVNCGGWYRVSSGETCALVTSKNAISLRDFYFLNPEIDANCTNLWADTSYCVGPVGDITTYPGYYSNDNAVPTPTITLTWASLTPVSAPTYSTPAATGYPLANGSLANCFQVFDNSYGPLRCYAAADMFGVSVFDWVLWNPSVLAAAGGNYSSDACFLANETQYCGSFYDQSLVPTTDPRSAFLPVPTDATANATTQCLDWYQTREGDTCDSICKMTDIPFSSFLAWNPALGENCQNLWLEAEYCVAGPGWSTVYYGMDATTTASSTSAPGTATSSAVTPPGPTQSGAAPNCQKWYIAVAGDSCQAIADAHGITLDQFYAWNPAVGTNCANLWAKEAYCVLAPSASAPATTTRVSTTSVTPPGPTQSGIPANCNKYAVVTGGSGCWDFAAANGISLDQLYLWNPVLNNNCENFWAGEAYCVGVSS